MHGYPAWFWFFLEHGAEIVVGVPLVIVALGVIWWRRRK